MEGIGTPVIILTGDSETKVKVSGFDLGADDYVTKPFQRAELLARIHAVIRRSKHPHPVITTGLMSLHLATRIVDIGGHRIQLTGKEYTILEMLSLRKGKTLTKETFMAHLYSGQDEPDSKIIDVFICKLRKKLAEIDLATSKCIETVWGRGYVLRDPDLNTADRPKVA